MRLIEISALILLALLTRPLAASEFVCVNGEPVLADLGEGVVMRTCMWNKGDDQYIRTGPLELIKNGILILQSQTNSDGKLHGGFTSWSDQGDVIEDGRYYLGQKHGAWRYFGERGKQASLHYLGGVLVSL